MMKALYLLAGGILIAIPVVWLLRNSRAATETAPYVVVRTDGAFELRDYPVLTLATTPMNGSGNSGAFGQLFGFITGKNTKAEKIPMTTPVLIDPVPGKQTMSFVLPEALVQKGVPEPTGGEVRITKAEPARYVVMRFKGGVSEKNQQDATNQLQVWMRAHNLAAESEPIFAYYDPPWTPVFMRRNEVMVRVAKTTQ